MWDTTPAIFIHKHGVSHEVCYLLSLKLGVAIELEVLREWS
jgi:hypothetical protein